MEKPKDVAVTTPPTTPAPVMKQYTNAYLLDLQIHYPESWTFETTTKSSSYDGALRRDITLKKANTAILFALTPAIDTGFAGPSDDILPSQANIQGSGISRYNANQKTYYATISGPTPSARLLQFIFI